MKDSTVLQHFGVLSSDNETALDTVVELHVDTCTNYELITITQTNEDGSDDVVCLGRHQLIGLLKQLKGH